MTAFSFRLVRSLVACLIGAALFGCALRHRVAAEPDVPLRVMTYNIQSGGGSRSLDGIVDAIRDAGADIVALQEVDVHWAPRSNFVDQAATLGQRLGMQVRFAPIYRLAAANPTSPLREFGVALLSRFPVVSWSNDTLTRLSTQEANPVPARMPGLLDAHVNVRGVIVRVFNTHLDYRADPAVRRQQVSEMLARIGAPTSPTLVFGDMNAPPDAPEIAPLLGRLHDAWMSATDAGLTYLADKPTKRIDYVLVSPHFRIRTARVPASEASDHRAVVADLVLVRAPRQ